MSPSAAARRLRVMAPIAVIAAMVGCASPAPSIVVDAPPLLPNAVLSIIAPAGDDVVVRPLDPANVAPPIEAVAGNAGNVPDIELPAGRYEVSVLANGVVLTTAEVELAPGLDNPVLNLRVLADDVPRACGVFDRALCDEAIAEAYAWGLFLDPGTTVTDVSVRPTTVATCGDGGADPLVDVTFLLEPAGNVTLTIEQFADGRLTTCTY